MGKDKDQKTHKLTDVEFWSALRENGGIYSRTAKYIQRKYNIEYTRQAVKQRATRDPEQLEDVIEEALDIAEEGLQALIRSGQPSTRLEAIKYFLKAKGRARGYGDKPMELAATMSSNEPIQNTETFSLTIKVMGNE